jgi:hypothetical protein
MSVTAQVHVTPVPSHTLRRIADYQLKQQYAKCKKE